MNLQSTSLQDRSPTQVPLARGSRQQSVNMWLCSRGNLFWRLFWKAPLSCLSMVAFPGVLVLSKRNVAPSSSNAWSPGLTPIITPLIAYGTHGARHCACVCVPRASIGSARLLWHAWPRLRRWACFPEHLPCSFLVLPGSAFAARPVPQLRCL